MPDGRTALSGLAGVQAIEVELQHDLLHVRYDPRRVTPEAMLAVVGEQGFQGKIVPPKG